MSKKNKEEIESSSIITSQAQIKNFLKRNEESHYNFEPTIDYKVSSGSLLLLMRAEKPAAHFSS